MNKTELKQIVAEKTPKIFQMSMILLCFLITVIDGYDILSISYVAPIIAREWELTGVELGFIFSSGLVGMTLGALVLSPLGDLYGRRTAILLMLLLISVGMLATAFSSHYGAIASFRFLTGLGIGGIASNIGTTILEFVAEKSRTKALGLVFVGTPIGAIISGSLTLFVVENLGWPAVFVSGGLLTFSMFFIVLLALPESIEYLLSSCKPNRLRRLNHTLTYLKLPKLDEFPEDDDRSLNHSNSFIFEVFKGKLLARTIPIGLIHLFYMFGFYAFVNWSATLLTNMGLVDSAGISVAMLIYVGGIGGALTVGWITPRLGLLLTTAIGFFAAGLGLIAFGFAPENIILLGMITVFSGYFFFGIQVSLYTFAAACYPTNVRATAIGLAFTIGRIGSIIGPLTAGYLFDAGFDRAIILTALALPQLLATALIIYMKEQLTFYQE